MKNICAIVLAAGKGTRMKSDKPKVLHLLAGKPMLFYTLEKLEKAGIPRIVIVIGHKGDDVKKAVDKDISFKDKIEFREQPEQKGTGDAVRWGMKGIECKNVIVVNGDDSAFYSPQTVEKIVNFHKRSSSTVTFVSIIKKDPYGLGRIIRDKNGKARDIVEEKDASEGQKKINEVNAGFYLFDLDWLKKNIEEIKISKAGEYYVVDLVRIAANQGKKVSVFRLEDDKEWYGVNTKENLEEASRRMGDLLE